MKTRQQWVRVLFTEEEDLEETVSHMWRVARQR